MDLNRCNVELKIQELVLIDVPVQDRQGIKEAVTAELTRLFQLQGIPRSLVQGGDRTTLSTDPISISTSLNQSNSLGIEIAQAIYRGLGG